MFEIDTRYLKLACVVSKIRCLKPAYIVSKISATIVERALTIMSNLWLASIFFAPNLFFL